MLSREDNELLPGIEPGTPMGSLFSSLLDSRAAENIPRLTDARSAPDEPL